MRIAIPLLLALVLVLAWWLEGGEDRDPIDPPPVEPASAEVETVPAPPMLEGSRPPATAEGAAAAAKRAAAERPTGKIAGRVVSADDGTPVSGVPVFAAQGDRRLSNDLADDDPRGKSDAAGRYALTGAKAGSVTVFAFGGGWVSRDLTRADCRSGYDPFHATVGEGTTVERDLILVAAGRVTGRVLDRSGGPIGDAEVRAVQFDGRRGGCDNSLLGNDYPFVPGPPRVRTDAAGAFAIDTLIPGVRYQVDASAEGFEWASAVDRVEAASGETVTIDVVLERTDAEPAWFLEVEVRERATNRPVEGAEAGDGVTDAAGFVRIGPLRGSRVWGVRAEGFFRADLDAEPPADLSGPEPTRRLVVLLDPAARIAGRVLAPDGAPAARATVRIGQARDPSEARRLPWDYTEADGEFEFSGRDPGGPVVRLHAVWTHEGRPHVGEASASPGDEDVEIRLRRKSIDPAREPRRIAVRTAEGRKVSRATVRIYGLALGEIEWGGAAVGSGQFFLAPKVVPFRLEITEAADASGRPLPVGAAHLGPFASTAAVPETITLPAGGRIEGRVIDEADRPVPGLKVEARANYEKWPGKDGDPPAPVHATAYADAEGRFVLDRLGDFVYRIRIRVPSPWREPTALNVRPGHPPLTVRLGEAYACTITVLGPEGRPVAGAKFRIAQERDGQTVHFLMAGDLTTGADGRCRLEGWNPGKRYVLQVSPGKRKDLAGTSIDGWRAVDTTVRLDSRVAVEGVVADEEGRPLAGASVVARRAAKNAPSFYEYDFADENGQFRLDGVPPGRARIEVTCKPFLEPRIYVVDVPTEPLRLEAPRGRTAWVLLANPSAVGARLDWRVAGPRWDGGIESKSRWPKGPAPDRLVFEHLVPGRTYALFIEVPDEELVGYVPNLGASDGPVRVSLVPGRTLTGRVLPPDGGTRLPDVRVRFHLGHLEWETETEGDGSFEIRQLPPGRGTLNARARVDAKWYVGATEAEPGTPAEITLSPAD